MKSAPSILAKGFRPFFLLAASLSVAFVPLWLLAYTGHVEVATYWPAALWHGHEMVFGFALAVVAGFLLTAVSNWTARQTAVGLPLLGLCGIWLAGRLAMLSASALPAALVAGVDLLFIPALALAIGRPLIATKNRRNFVFLGVMALLWLANATMHLSAIGVLEQWARPALIFALDLIIVIILIIGGRIIPMFTRNATGAPNIRSHRWLERLVFASFAAGVLLEFVWPASHFGGAVWAVAGLAALARMTHWGFQHTLRAPILWVLHVGYAWVGVGLLLRAAAVFWPQVPSTAALHALTVGAIGMLTLGMMARVARGHTGRALHVSWPLAAAFVAVALAAVARTILPLVLPDYYVELVVIGGVLWASAFFVYLIVYTPILIRPRADGRPG
jgi:uncharacterized protein involved in response to NO